MKREFLTGELGLPKEITDKIMAQYGESVNKLRTEAQTAQGENERLSGALSALKEDAESGAKLREMVQALESEKERLEKEAQAAKSELYDTKLNGAIVSALSAAGAKNVKAAGALLDKSAISVDEEGTHGLAEQIEAMKRDCGYLFHDGFASSGMRHGPQANAEDGFTHFARAGAKLK